MGVPWYSLHLNPTYLSQTTFGIDFLVEKCCGLHFKTTRRNQDLDMELKVKLQKPTNKKQEEKIKLNWKNGRELSDDKLYTINFLPLANGEIIWDRAGRCPPPSPFHLHFRKYIRSKCWSWINTALTFS